MRRACPQYAFTDRDHWSLHGGDVLYKLTLLTSSPLSNRLKMLLSTFYLRGFKNGGKYFCDFYIAAIEYTVSLCGHLFRRISGHENHEVTLLTKLLQLTLNLNRNNKSVLMH